MWPPSPCASIRGRKVWMPLITPPRFTAMHQSQSAKVIDVTPPIMPIPALLHSTWMGPNIASAASAAACIAARSVTSSTRPRER